MILNLIFIFSVRVIS